jgi:hypothetical protein
MGAKMTTTFETRSIQHRSPSAPAREPELLIHDEEERLMGSVRALARLMDDQFEVPGTKLRVGLDALVGLVPGVGDLVSTAISLWIVNQARRLGVSRWVLARMGWNVLVDAGVGAIPLAGDAFDLVWKSNRRNIVLLEKHLAARRSKRPPRWTR